MFESSSFSMKSISFLFIALCLGKCQSEVLHDGNSKFLKGVQLFGVRGGGSFVDEGKNILNDASSSKIEESEVHAVQNINATSEDEDEAWRSRLPSQLQKRRGSLHRILLPLSESGQIQCELYLLGTAHVSKDSCEDAKLLMEHIKPHALFLELCEKRLQILYEPDKNMNWTMPEGSFEKLSVSQITKELMMHNPGMSKLAALSTVLLNKVQSDYAEKLRVNIGGEFKEAFKVATTQQQNFLQNVEKLRAGIPIIRENNAPLNGCFVVLGDRPVGITLLRTWESLKFFGKIKLVCGLLWSSLQQPDEKELREWIESVMNDPTNDILSKSIEELNRHFPTVKETIIAERDTFMSCKLLQTARFLGQRAPQDGSITRTRIVAIVGAGHCPGIRKHLGQDSNLTGPNVEEALKAVIETKKRKLDESPEMKSLIKDVLSVQQPDTC